MTKKPYCKPELLAYGRVEHITHTFDKCFDLDGDGDGKMLAWAVDWRGCLPIPLTKECTVEHFS